MNTGLRGVMAVLLVAGVSATSLVHAQSSSPAPDGAEVFKRACAGCHVEQAAQPAVALGPLGPPPGALAPKALPPERLRVFTPEAILTTLTTGKMQAQAAALTDAERRAVAEFASGQTFSAAAEARTNSMCKDNTRMGDITRMPQWNGWGNGVKNVRYQSKEQGGLTAADLPRLKLKWAFGYANIASARAQPIVAGGRLFAASENTEVHALNAKTGCTYWTFKAKSGVRSAMSVGPYKLPNGKSGQALFFGDTRANVYALDAQTGEQLWTVKADSHPLAGITGAPVVYGGRVFVPIQGISEEGQGANNNYACCTFRGSLTVLDANTGALVWKTYTVAEPRPRGKTAAGVEVFGPAGGSIWASPTIDEKRGLVYVATGNGFADPPQPTTDAVLALDIHTGAIKWKQQMQPNDSWAMGCKAKNPDNPACPGELGPDYDFSAPPALVTVKGRDLIVLPQKSGLAYALDPDAGGKLVWTYRIGKGSGLGGQWGGASDGENVYFGTADLLTPTPGGMHAVRALDGKPVWTAPPQPKLCEGKPGCVAGQGGPLTVIPGAVLNAGHDGGLRAYSTKDGSILWTYNTHRDYQTVNGVHAHGGSMDSAGPIVVDGMLYINSGYGGLIGVPGNVLLAFGLD
ncbi:MAG: PQQ-binding-like beta-propeller repeat protein [Steroidobacteraceae bacterium]|nr:PQQ-binding-like beta-propeller repeat protein [Steroidobacteraceae bacterium]